MFGVVTRVRRLLGSSTAQPVAAAPVAPTPVPEPVAVPAAAPEPVVEPVVAVAEPVLAEPPAPEPTPEPAPAPITDPTLTDAYMSGWFLHETQELYKGFKIEAHDRLLDIGCGDGTFTRFCAAFGPEIICADVDGEKIAEVERSLQDSNARSVTALVTDANPLPLPDNHLTKIVAMEVLEHVADPKQFVSELVRVGEPGAQYLFSVPDSLVESVQKHLAPPCYFEHPNHIRVFERDAFEQLIRESGLEIEQRGYYGFYWSVWWYFFWACKQDLSPPWHPLLQSWQQTWGMLLDMPDGPRIKKVLDDTMPKSQLILARKPRN